MGHGKGAWQGNWAGQRRSVVIAKLVQCNLVPRLPAPTGTNARKAGGILLSEVTWINECGCDSHVIVNRLCKV